MEEMKFPSLRLAEWKATRDTLHKYCKMLGAIREKMSEPQPHWWHINLRVGENELTTLPIYKSKEENNKSFELKLDMVHRKLIIFSSYREAMYVALTGQSLSALCDETCSLLSDIGIYPPVEKPSFIDGKPGTFEPESLINYWNALKNINAVFGEFKSGIKGKTSSVQLWPHHFDLAVSWFSGGLIPGKDSAHPEESEEQMTFGFSTGDETIPDAYFYATAYPEPEKMLNLSLPGNAFWNKTGFTGAVMMYNSIVEIENGSVRLLEFLKSVHSSVSKIMIAKN
jgi:Family of unknown function (DUF5996)